jgi:hypothetical protein
MRFLCVYKPSRAEGGPPDTGKMAEMGKFMEESFKSGILLATEGCMPSAKGARVRLAGGKVTVTDGPFAETRELIGGFALINANSKEEAVKYTEKFIKIAGDGETEIRQIYEMSDFAGCRSEVAAD